MKRLGWEVLGAIVLVAAGIAVGWQARGRKAEAKAREHEFFVELDHISTHETNLELICANRTATAQQLSQERLFEALNRADEILTPDFRFTDPFPIPNLTEAAWRASTYAKSNGAPPKTVLRAERLSAWLREQQAKPQAE